MNVCIHARVSRSSSVSEIAVSMAWPKPPRGFSKISRTLKSGSVLQAASASSCAPERPRLSASSSRMAR